MDKYTNKFHELNLHSFVSRTKCQTIAWYKDRLKGEIKKKVLTIQLVSVKEAYQLASKLSNKLALLPTGPVTNGHQSHHPQLIAIFHPTRKLFLNLAIPLSKRKEVAWHQGPSQMSVTSVVEMDIL